MQHLASLLRPVVALVALAFAPHLASAQDPGWLGVATAPHFDSDGNRADGVAIAFVWTESPAAEAGLLENDIILSSGDKTFRGPQQLVRLVTNAAPGDEIELRYRRGEEEGDVKITLGTVPEAELIYEPGTLQPVHGELTQENAVLIWQMIANDAKLILLESGIAPQDAQRIIAAMEPAREVVISLAKTPEPPTDKKDPTPDDEN